jgi:hypothetical protein
MKKTKGLKPQVWKEIGIIIFVMLLIAIVGYSATPHPKPKFISPVPEGYPEKYITIVAEPSPTPIPKTIKESIINEIKAVFGKDAKDALRIAECESQLNPKAVGDNGQSIGVFQIHKSWQQIYNERFLFDPAINIRIAYRIFEDSGWGRWTCANEL